MSVQPNILVRKATRARHTRTLSNGNKQYACYETSVPSHKKPEGKQLEKKIILRIDQHVNPQAEEAVSKRKTSFRLRDRKPLEHTVPATVNSLMKLPIGGSLKTANCERLTTNRQTEEADQKPLLTENARPVAISEISTARSTRRSPQHLNFFERPKIPHIMKHKFLMRAAGCEQDQQWNNYWQNIEKKISAIEPKVDESMLLGHSCVNLFAFEG